MSFEKRFSAITEFTVVARHLSFAAAARELEIDPSALSRRIAGLEARLGTRLFQRTTRRVTLTEAGVEYLARARDLLARADEADAAVSRYSVEPSGRLRVTVPNLFGQRHIAPFVPAFLAQHPQIRLDLTFSDHFEDLLDARLDCAVRIGALERGGDVIVRRLAPNRRLICAAPGYLGRFGSLREPGDLAAHRLLHFRPLMTGQTWSLHRGGHEAVVPVEPYLASDNAETLRVAAVNQMGIALLATFVIGEDLRSKNLVPVLPDWQPAASTISVVYPNALFMPRRVRVFVDFLVTLFKSEPAWDHGSSA
jgi:DNA-binding transcriptional LysR family regulator